MSSFSNIFCFSRVERIHAEGLNIDLLIGADLVEMWLNYKNPVSEVSELNQLTKVICLMYRFKKRTSNPYVKFISIRN
jgi:hypothetical protein